MTLTARVDVGSVEMTIANTGVGLDAEDLPHVFDRFYRADKSRARAEEHFGFGFAICKAVVEAERGRITVTSEPGAGTTCVVSFPTPVRE